MNIWDALTHPPTLRREIWEWDGARFQRGTYGARLADARRAAAALRRRGVGPGSIVAGVLTNGPGTTRAALGVLFTGAKFASLPIMARGMSVPAYVDQLSGLCKHLNAHCLLAEERFLAFMPDHADLGVEVIGYRSLLDGVTMADVDPPPLEDVLFVQFSSGTPGDPRGALKARAAQAHYPLLAANLIDEATGRTGNQPGNGSLTVIGPHHHHERVPVKPPPSLNCDRGVTSPQRPTVAQSAMWVVRAIRHSGPPS